MTGSGRKTPSRNTNNADYAGGNTNRAHRTASASDNNRNKKQSQKEKIEMARKIKRQTNSMNFKIRFVLSLVGLGACIYFLITAVVHGYGSEMFSIIRHIRKVPPVVVVVFDVLYSFSFFLLSWYILTNRRGHYTFWALRVSVALCAISAFGWLAILVITSREPDANVPWHLLGLPLTFLAVDLLVFLIDKELRRAISGEYEFRQIIRERGLEG